MTGRGIFLIFVQCNGRDYFEKVCVLHYRERRKIISRKRQDYGKSCGFYNRSNVKSIECEGEGQKYSKYIYVFRVFRFLSPTKLNRNELAAYSKAHSIQPLCLWGVGVYSVLLI